MLFSKKYKIVIADPCHEDWEKMTPAGKGRFCDSCSKNVTDYSVLNEFQITEMIRNNNGKLCGRFRKEQLDKIYTLQPKIRLSAQKRFFQYVMSLFMGSVAFFNKASGQSTFAQAPVDKIDTVKTEQTDSLKLTVQADSTGTDTVAFAEIDTAVFYLDSVIMHPELEPIDFSQMELVAIISGGIGIVYQGPELERPFIPLICDTVKKWVGKDPEKKEIAFDKTFPAEPLKEPQEPVKKEEPIIAILPEEIRRKYKI